MDAELEQRIIAVARDARDGLKRYVTANADPNGFWLARWYAIFDAVIAADDARIASEEAAKQQPPATEEYPPIMNGIFIVPDNDDL